MDMYQSPGCSLLPEHFHLSSAALTSESKPWRQDGRQVDEWKEKQQKQELLCDNVKRRDSTHSWRFQLQLKLLCHIWERQF